MHCNRTIQLKCPHMHGEDIKAFQNGSSLVCAKKAISSDVIWLDGVPYFSLGDLASLFDVPLVWSEEEGYCISSHYPIFASALLWTQAPFSSQKESGFFLVQGRNE